MRRRVHQEWANRVRAEYRSAALTAQALHRAIQCGLERDLLDTFLRVVRDELDHAALSHEVLVALGGDPEAVSLDVEALASPAAEGPLAALTDDVVRSFCLGETFAVPLFRAMRSDARHPAVLPVLERILKDEAVHRQLGWEALDALLAIDPEGVRARIAAHLPAWLAGYRRAYAEAVEDPPLSEEERAAGLLPAASYRAIHDATLADVIRPRFAARGIDA